MQQDEKTHGLGDEDGDVTFSTDEPKEGKGEEEEEENQDKVNFWETPEAQSLKEDSESKNKLAGLWDGAQKREKALRDLEKIVDESKAAVGEKCPARELFS